MWCVWKSTQETVQDQRSEKPTLSGNSTGWSCQHGPTYKSNCRVCTDTQRNTNHSAICWSDSICWSLLRFHLCSFDDQTQRWDYCWSKKSVWKSCPKSWHDHSSLPLRQWTFWHQTVQGIFPSESCFMTPLVTDATCYSPPLPLDITTVKQLTWPTSPLPFLTLVTCDNYGLRPVGGKNYHAIFFTFCHVTVAHFTTWHSSTSRLTCINIVTHVLHKQGPKSLYISYTITQCS